MQINQEFYEKILACWMGKNIGGTLGGPVEGRTDWLSFEGLSDLRSDGPLPNDDVDLQLVNLHALEHRGVNITAQDLSEEWAEHVYFPYDEYGYALTNIRKNLASPLSGCYNNPFIDCMGSPIRSELWAAIAPNDPDTAAFYAYHDSLVDHAGGEGMHGEVFLAVLESLAFGERDINILVEKALAFLPENSRVKKAVLDTLAWYRQGVSYREIREKILSRYGNRNFTDAPQNIAFIIVGLLYGTDFADSLIKTVNLGYDTDCTCATVGAIYGILYGLDGIPKEWKEKVGDKIKISREIRGFDYPSTIMELTDRIMVLHRQLESKPIKAYIPRYEDYFRQCFTLPDKCGLNPLSVSVKIKDNTFLVPDKAQEVFVDFVNNSQEVWDFRASLNDVQSGEVITLPPGGHHRVAFNVTPANCIYLTSKQVLTVERLHCKSVWKCYNLNFVLPVASRWMVDGSESFCESGLVQLSGKGSHIAETRLYVPSDRRIKLICASDSPVSVKLDGKLIIDSRIKGYYMPTHHRCPEEQYAFLDLAAGNYQIQVALEAEDDVSKFMLLPVAVEGVQGKKFLFYYIDCQIGM